MDCVFEEPNLMSKIVSHLTPKDAVNLVLSHGEFTKEIRFKDTIDVFLKKAKRLYDERVEFEKRKRGFCEFLWKELKSLNNIEGKDNRKQKIIDNFEYIVKNKDIVDLPEFSKFKTAMYDKLCAFLQNEAEGFQEEAIHYFDVLFGIKVRRLPYVPNTFGEFILTDSDRETIAIY